MTLTSNLNSAGFRPPAISKVTVGGFWGNRVDAIAHKTANILYERCVDAGMFDQIDPDRPVPQLRLPFQINEDGMQNTVTVQMFWDSDVAKVIETAAYALYRQPNRDLEEKIDEIIDMFARLQQPDGYLNSWYIRMQPGQRWTNLRDCHELYCAGHLIESAVAYHQATGKRALLDVMCRYADHIASLFGPGSDQKRGYPGHQEIELALVRLARETGRQSYLDLARFFIDARGQQPHYYDLEARERDEKPGQFHQKTYEYNQSHLPVRDQKKVVGHAVRAMYLYSGMADVATEFADDSLTGALELLWDDLTAKQMYVTGGIGPAARNEGFTDYYDLPNDSAYAETCASVGLAFWASRMLGRGPDRRYGDVMEQAIYNGALAGLSTDGTTFFYDNPLESHGGHHRWKWHSCPCCPPNIARLVASIGSYMYGVSQNAIAVHLYGESTAQLRVGTHDVSLSQTTQYPWDGQIKIDVTVDSPVWFALFLRIPSWCSPSWCSEATLSVNGSPLAVNAEQNHGYIRIDREWCAGDRIALDLPMQVRALHAHPAVRQDLGRVALTRGPLVYCLEGTDNTDNLNAVVVQQNNGDAALCSIAELGGAVAFDLPALRETAENWDNLLYRTEPAERETTTVRFVPYHLWDNRTPGEMLVWVRKES
tara:strand:- start:130354 stop:132312 length:1959 start_codon:yes stop_codon:yes gene_type:complete